MASGDRAGSEPMHGWPPPDRVALVRVLMLALVVALLATSRVYAQARTVDAQARAVHAFTLAAPPAARLRDARMIEFTVHRVVPIVPAADAAIPLLDASGARLGPLLDDGQFCELADAGAGIIDGASYRVTGTARTPQVNCRRYFSRLARKMPVAAGALGRSVFIRIETAHGLGARDFKLVPWRSVATAAYAIGTVLYVPSLRGWPIGPDRTHDGFVFVADALADAPDGRVAIVTGGSAFDSGATRHAATRVDDRTLVDELTALHRAQH